MGTTCGRPAPRCASYPARPCWPKRPMRNAARGPSKGPRWTFAPRLVPPRLANARWVRSRCLQCRDHVRTL
eukprot:2602611-Lingulodinium_polyedra.AAC.1